MPYSLPPYAIKDNIPEIKTGKRYDPEILKEVKEKMLRIFKRRFSAFSAFPTKAFHKFFIQTHNPYTMSTVVHHIPILSPFPRIKTDQKQIFPSLRPFLPPSTRYRKYRPPIWPALWIPASAANLEIHRRQPSV